MQLIFYIALNICIATYIVIVSSFKLNTRGGKSILGLSLGSLFCHGAYLLNVLSPSGLTDTILITLTFFGTTLASITLLTFSLEFTRRPHWITRFTISLLAIIPLFTQIVYWLPEIFQTEVLFPIILEDSALLEQINFLYRYSLIGATLWLLGRAIFLRSGTHKSFQLWSMLTGPLLAFISQGLLLLGLQWNWLGEFYLVSINLSAIGFAYNTFRHDQNAGLQVWRGNIIENMDDGWIILDMQNSIVDFNQATAKMAGIPHEKMYGKPITSVFNDFPSLTNTLDESQEIEMDRTVKVDDEYHYLNIRVSTLRNDMGSQIGRLVIWRDITNRRRAEDARQKARDEMFVLLNAISSAASQTSGLSEFLSEALYQIIYPFRSQIVFICLMDERSNHEKRVGYYVAAQLGLSTESSRELSRWCSSSLLFEWLIENRQHLLLEGPQDDRIPEPIRELNLSCVLAVPLIAQANEEKRFIGSLFLGRKTNSTYKQDEIVRLTILAEQIATLIDSDRRRKLAITLSERQRLMRDVHDSVSQKLYGLVTLTEAAQAAIEAGAQQDYSQVLSRMGENARQAVKELRLFLFQMQPIDLEKESLVSVLHHRLTAVEGRADIKARFLADEPISLSKKKEIALYYIAQEALNNVLRHAFAKSVSVTLKQGYKYVTFEVADDGCGFDKTKLERGGLGLENIRERVKQENGKLKISSKPGKGTIMQVIFEKDVPKKAGKK